MGLAAMHDRELLSSISGLEKVSKSLDPSEPLRDEWFEKVKATVNGFYADLPNLPAFAPAPDAGKNVELSCLGKSHDFSQSLEQLAEGLSAAGIQTAGGGHLGFIPGGGLWLGAVADYLASSFNHFLR